MVDTYGGNVGVKMHTQSMHLDTNTVSGYAKSLQDVFSGVAGRWGDVGGQAPLMET